VSINWSLVFAGSSVSPSGSFDDDISPSSSWGDDADDAVRYLTYDHALEPDPEPDPALQPIREPGEARRKIRILD
jgi:hypothetical protein